MVRVIIGKPGSGKGALARQVIDKAGEDDPGNQYLLINAGFSFDTDSLLNALKHFMFKVSDPKRYVPKSGKAKVRDPDRYGPESGEAASSPLSNFSREQFFCDPKSFSKPVPIENAAANPFVHLIRSILQPSPSNRDALIVVNGMERFFSIDGRPLSGELDHILRSIAGLEAGKTRFSFVFLGTARTQRYFETILGNRNNILGVDQIGLEPTTESKPVCGTKVKSRYFREIEQAFWGKEAESAANRKDALPYSDITIIDNNADSDIDSLRRAFFRAYLDPAVLKAGGISNPELALDLLRTLAFVGAPVEAIVLAHVPTIRRRLTDENGKERNYCAMLAAISECLQELKEKFLVVPVKSHESYMETGDHWKRYGLHKTLLKELRARHGIPLSPAKRSTAFNMSLYASQPIDGDSPEPQVHEELGRLVDSLIGAYKDFPSERESIFDAHSGLVSAALTRANTVLPSPVNLDKDKFLLNPETSAALRAALAVIRGYYSTSSLLRIDRHDRNCGEDNDGALLDHAERLHRLLRGYRKVVKARASMRQTIKDCAKDQEVKDDPVASMGPEPFYRDELVWLHNEMGVVHLTMGNLYAAEAALNRAVAANRMVEFDHHSHNWRRITLNYILLDIERARLLDAESKIETVERAINERKPQWKPNDHGKRSRVDHIIWAYGKETPVSTDCFDTDIMHEEMLSIGLTRGFRGLCAHLAGRLSDADEDYTTAIHILRRIGDQRAYALFLRRHGELKFALGEKAAAEMLLQKALSVADYGRQMDIVYQTMMVQHIHLSVGSSTKPAVNVSQDSVAQAYSTLKDTLEYSRALDIYRVRADASARLARLWLSRGDANAALESAHDAMAVAASFGMSLRKIQLRALIGQIYLQRGDPKAGRGMLDEAIDAADRVGYQRAIALARQIRNGNG